MRLLPCVAVALAEHEWRDPAVQRAIATVGRAPGLVCETRAELAAQAWYAREPVVDCSRWRALRGKVFIAVDDDPPEDTGTFPKRLFVKAL